MKRYVLTLVLLAALAVIPSGQTFVAKTAKSGPDLVITQIFTKELPGKPKPYIAVGHDDTAPNFVVKVTTKNIGNERAGRSTVRLEIFHNLTDRIRRDAESVGPLTPGMYRRTTFHIHGLKPHLGWVHFQAKADVSNKVHERNEHNNFKVGHELIYVVARQWKVTRFQTQVTVAGINQTASTSTDTGFAFKLREANAGNDIFYYDPYGQVKATFDETGACTAHGEDTQTENPWFGNLTLRRLAQYSAFMPTSTHAAESTPLYCGGQFIGNESWNWSNLYTADSAGDPNLLEMISDDTQLAGHAEKDSPQGHVTLDWNFQADVVYH